MLLQKSGLLLGGLVIALVISAGSGANAQTVSRTVSLSPRPPGSEPVGIWSGNSLVKIENHSSGSPVLCVYDESGHQVQRVAVQIPDAELIAVVSSQFARSSDGYLAVTGWALGSGDRAANFLAVISPDGAHQTVLRTEPYEPKTLTFASDGTIWTAGIEKNAEGRDKGRPEPGGDYFVIRRFDKTGTPLGGALSRTLLPEPAPLEGSRLVASKERVGWFSPWTGSTTPGHRGSGSPHSTCTAAREQLL